MATSAILRHRRDTAANWTANDPVLEDGQQGFETDTLKSKLGDGVTAWTALSYASSPAGGGTVTSVDLANSTGLTASGGPIVGAGSLTYTLSANLQAWHGLATSTKTDSAVVPSTAPSAGQLLVGNAGGTAYAPVSASGDATVASTGAITIANSAVTLAKMADMATDSFLGRDTAGAGAPEVLSVATVKTLLNLAGTNTGDQTITLTGDVTGSGVGSFAATIANDAVTYAKMQDVSATDMLLGRSTAGAGNVEEIPCTAAGRALLDDASAAAQRTTLALGAGTVDDWTSAQTMPDLFISDAAGVARDTRWQTAGSDRWIMRCDGTAESGANAGSDWQFLARSDAGAAIGMVCSVVRATQVLTFNQSPVVPTAAAISNDTKAASTAYVDRAAVIPLMVAVGDETTALTTGAAKVTFRMPFAATLIGVRASVTTAPTGGTLLTVDINESGTTVLSTKLTFDASEKTTTTAATPAVISDSALADDAEMTIDIDAVGSTIAGAGLKVTLLLRKSA